MIDRSWHECFRLWPVPSIEGGTVWLTVMRRVVMGRPQYRALTDAEKCERLEDMAW